MRTLNFFNVNSKAILLGQVFSSNYKMHNKEKYKIIILVTLIKFSCDENSMAVISRIFKNKKKGSYYHI